MQRPDAMSPRRIFVVGAVASLTVIAAATALWAPAAWSLVLVLPLVARGTADMLQRSHTILRNFPLVGHGRYLLESIRAVVYQRAKRVLDTRPFGTQRDVYAPGYEWIDHSLLARAPSHEMPRIQIGGPDCRQPYSASVLNISAMSYGALSPNAILALSTGAKAGGFFHNTGEGGVSPYHLQGGADLVWQLGTGYFGARDPDGNFDAEKFAAMATHPQIKMIEVKLSQGAKPGHGGILPAAKLTPELAQIRGVPMGRDVLSPPAHSAFQDPPGLLRFLARLRELSGGKPVGFKLCLGRPHEFFAICKAMRSTGITPDFITVDGGEGGTGAAPLEFSNSVGYPLTEALVLVHDALVGFGLRERIRVLASGKVVTGFALARLLALGADAGNSARGMMLSLGCIQALRCNNNTCPAGVATQDPALVAGLDPPTKATRVHGFHHGTVHALMELVAAAGLESPAQLTRRHIHRRIDATYECDYERLYPEIEAGCFLREGHVPPQYAEALAMAQPESFAPAATERETRRAA
jgi:glutamate synthase domain-containing protein 2